MAGNLALFKSKMKTFKMSSGRGSTINHAFASALAVADVFDAAKITKALAVLGQAPTDLRCVYCSAPAQGIDHLHGLVENTRYTGHGHVIGNLVPACNPCNTSKGNKPWREWAKSKGASEEQLQRIADYELLAPPAVGHDELKQLYPDLMEAYERLRLHTRDMLKTADHLAREIQRLESERLHRPMTGSSET